jgi:nitric oxide reductase NorD protein
MTILTQLNAQEMEDKLDHFLDPVLSFRRSAAAPAKKIAELSLSEQKFALHWVEIVSASNAEMAYQFSAHFSDAVSALKNDLDAVELWLVKAMSAYDERGVQFSNKVLAHSHEFAQNYFKKQQGIELDNVSKLLTTFVCGLNGRHLKIESAENSYTDTETIYLPAIIADYPSKDENFLYYKLLTVYLWAQNWFGTWRGDWDESLSHYENPQQALELLNSLESIRLLFCIQHELPGFYRQMSCFLEDLDTLKKNKLFQQIQSPLSVKSATVETSLRLLKKYYSQLTTEPLFFKKFNFQGILQPNKVNQIKQKRLLEEKTRFRKVLNLLAEDKSQAQQQSSENQVVDENKEHHFKLKMISETELAEGAIFELDLNGELFTPSADVQSLISSIIQDLGEIPPEYLQAAGPGKYSSENTADHKVKADVWSGVYHENDAFFYDEWDHLRQHYRKNWCVVRELKVKAEYDNFVPQTLLKYQGIVKSLRRNFEILKGEEKLLKRQRIGDDIDLDSLVEAYADLSVGMELSEYVFTRMQREDRNIAVMFMVDMSGSTKGWINQAEREALVLLCESLELLGDRYAIYGFSGTTRKRCEIYHIKHFDENYNDKVKARISGISAKDYTRMGFAIRHLSTILEGVEARTKLLITLSDGKPEDYDGQYRGKYGIEDTRQALFEVQRKGIHPYCITIDKEAGDYLAHMYGAANYSLIEDINKLPLKVSEIYRKLTS